MRTLCFTVLLAVVLPSTSHGDVLIPGIVTFDPPHFFSAAQPGMPVMIYLVGRARSGDMVQVTITFGHRSGTLSSM